MDELGEGYRSDDPGAIGGDKGAEEQSRPLGVDSGGRCGQDRDERDNEMFDDEVGVTPTSSSNISLSRSSRSCPHRPPESTPRGRDCSSAPLSPPMAPGSSLR